MIGSTLKHYRIVDKLGEGGMASVYLADDTRLDRQVALKVLPAELSDDPRRIERFEREAKAVAALNHPNIVTIYSVEEADGVHFLTMELVDGQSLDQIIPEGGLDPSRFFELARPLMAAVSAAHRKGIVHRDIKPANVMVNSEGIVKLLDLGLAKLDSVSDSGMSTVDETLTAEGRVIGTVPYMAPEQLTGRPLDHRIDVYALGVVFHEMLTGSRPFRADSTAELISAILRDAPPRLEEARRTLPDGLGPVVDRCLEKQPHYRFQSVEELAGAVETVAEMLAPPSVSTDSVSVDGGLLRQTAKRSRRWPLVVATAAAAIALTAGLTALLRSRSEPAALQPVDLSIAVLPMDEVGDSPGPELVSELTDQLRESLAAVSDLELIDPPADAPADGSEGAPTPDYALAGEVEWLPSTTEPRAKLSFELTRSADGAVIWTESFDRPDVSTRMERNAVAATVRARIGDLLGLPTPPAPHLVEAPPESAQKPRTTSRQPAPPRAPPPAPAAVEEKPGTEVSAIDAEVTGAPPPEIELALYVISNQPEGVLTVYADGERVYEREFEFTERKAGVLGRVGLKRKVAGELSEGMLVPAEVEEIRVYVALPGQPARYFALAPSLLGDGTDRLVIDIRKKEEIDVFLESTS